MARQSVVFGWRGYRFGGVDFARYVTSWEDTRDRSGPSHKYIKRDGGESEDMGREPHRAVVHLAYVGQNWQSQFLALQSEIDSNPIQTLTHPVYGPMRAHAKMSVGGMDIENSPNLYSVTITFIESQLDTNLPVTTDATAQGPATKLQKVSVAATAFIAAGAPYLTASTAVSLSASLANSYAAAAVTAAVNQTVDATLPQQLATALGGVNAAVAAIKADPRATPGSVDAAYAAAELLYDSVAQVDDSVKQLRPTLYPYVLPRRTHITYLMRQFYGPQDGPQREAEFLANNPTISDPGFMRSGTLVWLATATAVR